MSMRASEWEGQLRKFERCRGWVEASREKGSRTRVLCEKEKVGRRCSAFCFFFFPLNYNGFLLKLVVNLITYNILRRFSTTVLKCVSQNTLILTIITKMPLYHFLSQFLYNRRRNGVVKSYFCSSDKFSLKVVWYAYAYFLLNY